MGLKVRQTNEHPLVHRMEGNPACLTDLAYSPRLSPPLPVRHFTMYLHCLRGIQQSFGPREMLLWIPKFLWQKFALQVLARL